MYRYVPRYLHIVHTYYEEMFSTTNWKRPQTLRFTKYNAFSEGSYNTQGTINASSDATRDHDK